MDAFVLSKECTHYTGWEVDETPHSDDEKVPCDAIQNPDDLDDADGLITYARAHDYEDIPDPDIKDAEDVVELALGRETVHSLQSEVAGFVLPVNRERTLGLSSLALILDALRVGAVASTSSEVGPGPSVASRIADAYALVGLTRLQVNVSVSLRPLDSSTRSTDVNEALEAGYILQIAYNESISSDPTRFSHSYLRALVAQLRVRDSIIGNLAANMKKCTICDNRRVGCAEEEIADMIVECNAEVIDRRILGGRKAVLGLVGVETANNTIPRSRTCLCGRWMLPTTGCDSWTLVCHFHSLIDRWGATGLSCEETSALRKQIVFTASAIARAPGHFLETISKWTKSLFASDQPSLSAYVQRLAEIGDAINVVLLYPPPSSIELIGDGWPTLDLPSAYDICKSHGNAALSAAGLPVATRPEIFKKCCQALSKRCEPIANVPVHAEIKLLMHWLMQPSEAQQCPLGNYIASARKPCFSCSSFFQAVRIERGTAPPVDDAQNLIYCAPSSQLVHPRWQFPDCDLITPSGQSSAQPDKIRSQKIYKYLRKCYRTGIAAKLDLPLPL